jgi:hypothetical protein
VIRAGAKKPIEKAQLFRLPQHLRSHHPWKRFNGYWREEFAAHGEEASLFRALRKTFFGQWYVQIHVEHMNIFHIHSLCGDSG